MRDPRCPKCNQPAEMAAYWCRPCGLWRRGDSVVEGTPPPENKWPQAGDLFYRATHALRLAGRNDMADKFENEWIEVIYGPLAGTLADMPLREGKVE